MALPTIEECTCTCHLMSVRQYAVHPGACCTGQTLAWEAWGIEEAVEAVAIAVAFSEED